MASTMQLKVREILAIATDISSVTLEEFQRCSDHPVTQEILDVMVASRVLSVWPSAYSETTYSVTDAGIFALDEINSELEE